MSCDSSQQLRGAQGSQWLQHCWFVMSRAKPVIGLGRAPDTLPQAPLPRVQVLPEWGPQDLAPNEVCWQMQPNLLGLLDRHLKAREILGSVPHRRYSSPGHAPLVGRDMLHSSLLQKMFRIIIIGHKGPDSQCIYTCVNVGVTPLTSRVVPRLQQCDKPQIGV